MRRLIVLASLVVVACSATHTKRRVDGSYAIECNSQKACLDSADRLCGETGYNIIGGRHDQKVYGVPGNQKLVGKDELYIRCKKDTPEDAPDPQAGSWKLERPDGGTKSSGVKAGICRPGETQRCVGAGACVGGQYCKMDGSGFGPCDCGVAANTGGIKPIDRADAGAN
jgi:hypothetical protein